MQITNSKIFWPLCGIALLVVIFFSFFFSRNKSSSVCCTYFSFRNTTIDLSNAEAFFHSIYNRTVCSQLHFSFSTFNSFLAGLGRNEVYVACCFSQTDNLNQLGKHYSRVRNKRTPLNKHSPWIIWQKQYAQPLEQTQPPLKQQIISIFYT